MSTAASSGNTYIKPAISGIATVVLDKFMLKNNNMLSSAYFGASVAASLYIVALIQPQIPNIFPDIAAIGAKGQTLSNRVAEIMLSTAGSYGVNKLVFKNDTNPQLMLQKFGVILAADLIGEYASDYFNTQPLSYLA